MRSSAGSIRARPPNKQPRRLGGCHQPGTYPAAIRAAASGLRADIAKSAAAGPSRAAVSFLLGRLGALPQRLHFVETRLLQAAARLFECALYGMQPDGKEDFGINLGAMATRGERGALIVSLDSLLRMTSNPFFPYLLARIEEGIGPGVAAAQPAE